MSYLNKEELQIASRFLFLSMAVVVVEQDAKRIRQGNFKIKEPYTELLGKMATIAKNERRTLRKKMQQQEIEVVTLNQNETFSSYLFLCKGREEQRNYFNPAIRKKVEAIVRELMSAALAPSRDYASAKA
ncbi:uncharacterized protein JNUCC1_00370 [Lentibacillus sp. JNUCC-1]|uniref:hypothetical protein n=1 Tax=Lentibacillus sp. JNUCC-1 TaxID=2654513 RepID=UPI0012E80C6C|nr:hypothetical protein [Lentibacillus sp. JNUCC-1]MUV36567.1 uncharacterized protein [Lentibacillus sp. JNUCC-1]